MSVRSMGMKEYSFKIIIGVILACTLFVGILYLNNDIGISANNLEKDIRTSQKIQNDWIVKGEVSDTMAAFISYPPSQDNHTFSIYVNRSGLSFGYFFRGGGKLDAVNNNIMEFTIEGYKERAFISMNRQQVNRLIIDDGDSVKEIQIDCEKPFAIVLPVNAGFVTFYDVNGNTLDYISQSY